MSDDEKAPAPPPVRLEPGDLTAEENVALHHDLGGDPASGAYRKAWDAWHARAAKLAAPVGPRVTAYIDATFRPPEDRSRGAATIGGVAAAGLGAAELASAGGVGAAHAVGGAGGAGLSAVAPDAALRAVAGQVTPGAGAPVATTPGAHAASAAGDVDVARFETVPKPKRRWPAVAGTALVVVGGAALVIALVANHSSSSTTPKPRTTQGAQRGVSAGAIPVVKNLPVAETALTTCLERVRVPYQIIQNVKPYIGKTAVVAAAGSREGQVTVPIAANGTFTAQFTEVLQKVSATRCKGSLTFTVVSVGGVKPTTHS
jgi:hypothetical protein